VASHASTSAITQSAVRPGWVLVSSSNAAIAEGPATPGIAIGTMKRLAFARLAENAAAIGRRKHHADADQEQHDAAGDADRIRFQLQQLEDVLAAKQETSSTPSAISSSRTITSGGAWAARP
jgi:hypothetical protein